MGTLGWAPDVVDRMEVWQVARFLGIDRSDPVAAGSRGIMLPSDAEKSGKTGAAGFVDSKVEARAAEWEARIKQQRQNAG